MCISKLMFSIISISLLSCNNSSNENIKSNESKEVLVIDTPKSLQEIISMDNIRIDSTKLIKAFDDILFGTKSKQTINSYYKKIYSISNYEFNFDNEVLSDEFGLYKFTLVGVKKYSFNLKNGVIGDIEKIIRLSYPNVEKTKEVYEDPYGLIERRLQAIETDVKAIPKDYLTEVFISRYQKNEIRIKVGYKIDYRPENYRPLGFNSENTSTIQIDRIKLSSKINYEKLFTPLVSFIFLSEYSKVEQKIDSLYHKNKEESTKKDVEKF